MIEAETNSVRVSLAMTSVVEQPEMVSSRTGLIPTRTWTAGSPIERSIRRHKENGWQLIIRSETFDEPLKELLEILRPVEDGLKACLEHWKPELVCVIYSYESFPSVHFDRDDVQFLSRIGCEIDIDAYCLGEVATADGSPVSPELSDQ